MHAHCQTSVYKVFKTPSIYLLRYYFILSVMTKVRTRLAPSPTGFMHIGTLRTALFGYLFTRKHQGAFILRIEDTDQTRFVEGATEAIIEGLDWAGLELDEGPHIGGAFGPYTQTERNPRHIEVAEELLKKEAAYRCFCTSERLTELREQMKARGLAPQYDRRCRHLTHEESAEQLAAGQEYTVRLKMPLEGEYIVDDIIKGRVSFPAKDIDDQIILKSDGLPTYHLAAMVDDHDMEITHIIRTDEWLTSTPKHIQIFKSMEWDIPQFAHAPMVLNEDRTKMSKRKGRVDLREYIKDGYLTDALLNFLVFLGWSAPEDKEIWTVAELIEAFTLEKVHRSPAIFQTEKLNWFNAQYIRKRESAVLAKELLAFHTLIGGISQNTQGVTLEPYNTTVSNELFERIVEHAKGRMILLKDFLPSLHVYFWKEASYDFSLLTSEKMKVDHAMATTAITFLQEALSTLDDNQWTMDGLKIYLLAAIKDAGYKNGQILWPMRAALSGSEVSPGAFEMADILGKSETLRRFALALEKSVA